MIDHFIKFKRDIHNNHLYLLPFIHEYKSCGLTAYKNDMLICYSLHIYHYLYIKHVDIFMNYNSVVLFLPWRTLCIFGLDIFWEIRTAYFRNFRTCNLLHFNLTDARKITKFFLLDCSRVKMM